MSSTNLNKLLLSKRAAAKKLGCSHEKLNNLINKGLLKVFIDTPNSFSVKIPISSIESYIEKNSYDFSDLNRHLYNT